MRLVQFFPVNVQKMKLFEWPPQLLRQDNAILDTVSSIFRGSAGVVKKRTTSSNKLIVFFFNLQKMETTAKENIQRSTNACHITRVNTFCLLNILQYLNVLDLIKMCQLHPMFHKIITQHLIGNRLFDFNQISYYYLIELLFEIFGPFIREINFNANELGEIVLQEGTSCNEVIFEHIARFCKELRKICLELSDKKSKCLTTRILNSKWKAQKFSREKCADIIQILNKIAMNRILIKNRRKLWYKRKERKKRIYTKKFLATKISVVMRNRNAKIKEIFE